VISWVAAAFTLLIAITDMNDFAAIGLYLTLFGGVAWVGALVWERRDRKKGQTQSGERSQSD
jgi:hypothetical protein